jgi:predicted phosphodiesterase
MQWTFLLLGCQTAQTESRPADASSSSALQISTRPLTITQPTFAGSTGQDCVVEPPADPCPRCDTELLRNGDFEEGSMAGWSVLSGSCGLSGPLSWLTPEGSWMLSGGAMQTGMSCLLGQTLSLADFSPALIDRADGGDGLVAVLTGWLANYNGISAFDDQAVLRVVYLDEEEAELARLETLLGAEPDWSERTAEGLLPAGTRKLRVEIEGRYRQGNLNESSADAVSLQLTRAVPQPVRITLPPMLQDTRPDAMRLLWQTDRSDMPQRVLAGAVGDPLTDAAVLIRTTEVSPEHYLHVADLEGLQPATVYSYRIIVGDPQDGGDTSDTHHFRTAPDPDGDEPVMIAWTADNQDNPYGHFETHIGHIGDRKVDMMISAGDIVQHGEDLSEWTTQWWDPLSVGDFAQSTPVMVARGNHDAEHPYAYAYTALPGNGAWYSFRYGPAFFVVLDTQATFTSPKPDLDQVTFIRDALASEEAASASWRIAVFHSAPYTNAVHGGVEDPEHGYGSEEVRTYWDDVLIEEGIDLVVSGHYHAYQRGEKDDVTYVVIGGGGGGLASRVDDIWDFLDVVEVTWSYSTSLITEDTLRWRTYDLNDELIDAVNLRR